MPVPSGRVFQLVMRRAGAAAPASADGRETVAFARSAWSVRETSGLLTPDG